MTATTAGSAVDGAQQPDGSRFRVCVVGSGWMFSSGISHYTLKLASALVEGHDTTVLLMRNLVPKRFYPGKARVGRTAELAYPPEATVLNGVNWYWGRSILRAVRLLRRRSPDLVILEWWTVAVLHSYLVLALTARSTGARIVIEFHETQDPGESDRLLARLYLRLLFPRLCALASGCIVHSAHDLEVIVGRGWFAPAEVAVVPHGPFDHLAAPTPTPPVDDRPAGGGTKLLYFGVVRPYKGVQVLAEAVRLLPDNGAGFHLTVAGEPWEDYTAPLIDLTEGPFGGRVTLIDRYVTDLELAELLTEADAVVLPYLRSSASGPLHMAMSWGLPVVVSDVEGLSDIAGRYEGAVLVAPGDPEALAEALIAIRAKVGSVYEDPVSWTDSVQVIADSYETCWSGR